MKETILVTGGAGYIGSHLVRILVEKGYNVRVLDRCFFGEESLLGVRESIELVKEDIRFVKPDILKGVYAVMDLCALSNDPSGELNPYLTFDINYLARTRIAKLAKLSGVNRYILASSCSVYGFQNGLLTEMAKTYPQTTYAKANVLWEDDALALASKEFCVTALRQATVYGLSPRMRFDLAVNNITWHFFKEGMTPLNGDGKQWRPFIHVKDTANAFTVVLEAKEKLVNKEVLNVGSNKQNYQIVDLAAMIAQAINLPFTHKFIGQVDNRNYKVDFGKIHKLLNFDTQYTPANGAKEIYEALKKGEVSDDIKTRTVEVYKILSSLGIL